MRKDKLDNTLNPYQLLKEAREGWDYFISDETVYERKSVERHRVKKLSFVDNYLVGDIWFEVLARVEKLGVALITEVSDDARVIAGQPNVRLHSRWCNEPMFVRIRKKFEVSEQVQFRPIPSIVWPKTFDLTVRSEGDKFKSIGHPLCGLSCEVVKQRKLDRLLLIGGEFLASLGHVQHGKSPSNVVEGVP